ncbi:hypothetical protein [Sporomusa carbonis]
MNRYDSYWPAALPEIIKGARLLPRLNLDITEIILNVGDKQLESMC